jgi:hypothetical protein
MQWRGVAAIHIELGVLMAMDGAAVEKEAMHIGQGLWAAMGQGNMVVAVAMDALGCRAAVAARRGMAGDRLAREEAWMVEVGNAVVVVTAEVEVVVVKAATVAAEEEAEVAEVEMAAAAMVEVAKAGAVKEATAVVVMEAATVACAGRTVCTGTRRS